MAIFKKKADREMEQRILIKRTIGNMNKFVSQLEQKKTKLIDQAKQARLKGIDSQYRLAVSGLKTVISQQRQAETMLLNFEITSQLKDLSELTAGFLEGMTVLSKEMSKITDNMDFVKAQKEFQRAMVKAEQHSEKMDIFMEGSNLSFESLSEASSMISDREIDSLIENQAADTDNSMDAEIEKRLQEVTDALKE